MWPKCSLNLLHWEAPGHRRLYLLPSHDDRNVPETRWPKCSGNTVKEMFWQHGDRNIPATRWPKCFGNTVTEMIRNTVTEMYRQHGDRYIPATRWPKGLSKTVDRSLMPHDTYCVVLILELIELQNWLSAGRNEAENLLNTEFFSIIFWWGFHISCINKKFTFLQI